MVKVSIALSFLLASVTSVEAGTYLNGTYLNGTYLNGTYLNGTYLNGTYLNGTYLNGTYLNGTYLNGTYYAGKNIGGMTFSTNEPVVYAGLSGSMLYGYKYVGGTYYYRQGTDFIGAHINGTTNANDVIPMTINNVRQLTGADSDVWLYTISYGGGWHNEYVWECEDPYGCWQTWQAVQDPTYNLCGTDDAGHPIEATAVSGQWDVNNTYRGAGGKISASSNVMTFACVNGAIGKCAAHGVPNTMGYKPWTGEWSSQWVYNWSTYTWQQQWTYRSYEPLHQACVRMVRADYCGDGNPHTKNGQPIDVADALAPQVQAYSTYWPSEGNWVPGGMDCISSARVDHDSYAQIWSGFCKYGANVPFQMVSVWSSCTYGMTQQDGKVYSNPFNSLGNRIDPDSASCAQSYDCYYAHECSCSNNTACCN